MANEQPEESRGFSFDIDPTLPHTHGQRLGKFSSLGRREINTPHYFASSSRGCVPHLTQDMARDRTGIKGIYTALEDCEYHIHVSQCCYEEALPLLTLATELASH